MTEIQKTDLGRQYKEHLHNADKCRNKDQIQLAASYEESAAKIEAKFQAEDCDIADYLE